MLVEEQLETSMMNGDACAMKQTSGQAGLCWQRSVLSSLFIATQAGGPGGSACATHLLLGRCIEISQ